MNPHHSTSLVTLIREWGEALGRGEAPSAEELCRDQPEMIEELEREIGSREMLRLGICTVTAHEGAEDAFVPMAGAEPVPGHRLVARIGGGGSGEVWRAIGPGGFPVAFKFVRTAEGGGQVESRSPRSLRKARESNLRSLELVRELRHPNLLSMFGAWARDGLLIIGMELADRTLMDRCNEAIDAGLPGIPMPELLGFMRQAARGIDHLNTPGMVASDRDGAGIQHRDIKPQNLLLIGDVVKLGDFGLAKLRDGLVSQTGSLTPAYAAPELYKGQISRHSDQYALAVTFCQLRGGYLPFGGSPYEVMMGHCMNEPDLGMVPEPERTAVARALTKEPEGRWPDCRSFVEAIAAAQGHVASVAPVRGRTAPRAGRRPVVLASLAVLVLACWLAIPSRDSAPPVRAETSRWLDPDEAVITSVPPAGPTPRDSTDEALSVPLQPERVAPLEPSIAPVVGPAPEALPSEAPRAVPTDSVTLKEATGPIASGDPSPPRPPSPTIAPVPNVEVTPAPDRREPPTLASPPTAPESRPAEEQGRSIPSPPPPVDVPATPFPRTATIQVIMPAATAELVVRGAVGKGQPDEWYGPRRVIHTPPMTEGAEYLVGAFWTDPAGTPRVRNHKLHVEPGMIYEVHLCTATPTSRPIKEEVRPISPTQGNSHEDPRPRPNPYGGPTVRK